jgi:hypothetical protein
MKKQKVMSKSSKKHVFKGVFSLVGLFACGLMLGLGLTDKADKPQVVNVAYAEPAQVQEPIKETCVVIEEILTERLSSEGGDYIYEYPRRNIEIYERLVKNGCPENVEKWKNAILREEQIIAALTATATAQRQTCDMLKNLCWQQCRGRIRILVPIPELNARKFMRICRNADVRKILKNMSRWQSRNWKSRARWKMTNLMNRKQPRL